MKTARRLCVLYLAIFTLMVARAEAGGSPPNAPACPWKSKLIRGLSCEGSAIEGESQRHKCEFMRVFEQRLCESLLRYVTLTFTAKFGKDEGGDFIRIRTSAPWRRDSVSFRVFWSRPPTKEDYSRDAEHIIKEVGRWVLSPEPREEQRAQGAVAEDRFGHRDMACPFSFQKMKGTMCQQSHADAVYERFCAFLEHLSARLCQLPSPRVTGLIVEVSIFRDGVILNMLLTDTFGLTEEVAAYVSPDADDDEVARSAEVTAEKIRRRFPPPGIQARGGERCSPPPFLSVASRLSFCYALRIFVVYSSYFTLAYA